MSAEEKGVQTPRPVPATRDEMKSLLEDMKQRPLRIPLPELTEEDRQALGERVDSYETRLRHHYVPAIEGSVFGPRRGRPTGSGRTGSPGGTAQSGAAPAGQPRNDFTRNADENMTLSYQFKTMLFWIVSRTNNCQYCLGHQEWKLQATGMSDDAIAALDLDWSEYTPKEQAAFEYARMLTFEPHKIDDSALQNVLKHYTSLQVLEMTMSVAGNNSINRWKEGTGIPQSSGNTFAGRGGSTAEHSDNFTTPTSNRYQGKISVVAPIEILNGNPTGRGVSTRPTLESREEVERLLTEAATRKPRLPMADEEAVKQWLSSNEESHAVTPWMQLLAVFPNEGAGRLPALLARERKTGELTELQKAQISWIIARQDRAWYALSEARMRLRKLGQSDDQIFALDKEAGHSDADLALYRLARNLAASPIALSDEDVTRALAATTPAHVVQTINLVTACAYFDRFTEAAGLPTEH